jgi:outer membrane receptor for ferrienterochelin and colicin
VTHRRTLVGGLLLGALLASAASRPSSSAAEPADDAFSLMREQTVTGVNKRPLPLSETPSSVTVIPAAEIRAMGYQTLGDALHWVRGVFVTYDRNYTYVGVRGLQRPGDYNNKILLTLDGHTLNGAVYGDAAFGPELGLDLEQVERIEVVRGPGSTFYGSYAALAVVNVVTRHPCSESRARLDLRAGGAGEWRGRASVASAVPSGPEWTAALSWLQAQGPDLYFAEFDDPLTHSGRAVGLDGERALSFFGTAEWGAARLAVKLSERVKTIPTASYGTLFGDDRNRTWDGRDYVELSATRRVSPALELSGRAYWDGVRYHGQYIYIYDPDPTPVDSRDWGDGDDLGLECRAQWAVGPQQALTLGLETQRMLRAHMKNVDLDPPWTYYDRTVTSNVVGTYLQDEFRFGHRLILTAGARLDHDSRFEAVVSPRADLVWTLRTGTRFKLLGGSAFRGPSPYEREALIAVSSPGTRQLHAERVATVEGTFEHEAGPFTASLTAYDNHVRNLIDLVEVDETGVERYANRARAHAQGAEAELRAVLDATTQARLALAWQHSEDVDTGAELTNSPRWNAHVLAYHRFRDGRTTLGAGARYLSSRLTLAGRRTAAAMVCDARVGRRLTAGLTAGVEVRNLFDARYGDPGSREHVQDQIMQDSRTFFVTLSYLPSESR